MALHIIIDGYNLIRQSHHLCDLDQKSMELGRDALVDMLAAYKRVKAHQITIVFDGVQIPSVYRQRDKRKGIEIRFSRVGETADLVIKRMAEKEREKALIVTSDNDVAGYCEKCNSAVISSPEFEDKLSMAAYMELKGVDDEDDTGGWQPTTRKKGPSRRLSKRKRKQQSRIRKL